MKPIIVRSNHWIPGASWLLAVSLLLLVVMPSPAFAAEVDCLMCHENLAKGKVVHAAVQMGCTSCHTGIDATDVPHKKKNKIAKGLSSMPPELCYGCHEKKSFEGKKAVHPPVMGGLCTNCHNPHSSDIPKLLLSELPDLCYGCHDKQKFFGKALHAPVGIGLCTQCHAAHQSDHEKLLLKEPPDLCYDCHKKADFSRKNVHAPVAGGMCLSCHKPHGSDYFALLKREPVNVCFECHAGIRKKAHAIVGMLESGHPLGVPKKGKKPVEDPARPGKRFYCGSCHNPHTSDNPSLFRYEARRGMELCLNCHKK
ncbi:MAG: hypothetical protein EPN25_06990 [Nitrospirae bacterium]|nr:MAG: hypothetical protein EPN25_06990 [Nitrospirota bacterium]